MGNSWFLFRKYFEVLHEAGTTDLPAKPYERKMSESEFETYARSMTQKKGVSLKSAPKVLSYEGEVSQISIGELLAYPKDPEKPEELTKEKLGITNHMRARPVAGGKRIVLDVAGEVRELKGFHQTETGHELPVIETRRVGSTVDLAKGETVVFGGVMSKETQVVEDKVPFLGDIPLLGALFRSRQTIEFDKELILSMTPQLIDKDDPSVASR